MKAKFIFLHVLLLLLLAQVAHAQDEANTILPEGVATSNHPEDDEEIDPHNPQNWGIYTREFRREHQFSLSVGMRLSHWEIEGLGHLPAYTGERKGVYEEFKYSFHLPFYRKTGFILGSAVGYQKSLHEFEDGFAPPEDFSLPGVLLGFVYDANPRSRGGISANYFLERWNAMRGQGPDDDPETSLHITVEVLDINPFLDFFFDLHWAVRMEAHFRQCFFHRPRSPENTAMDIRVSRRDQGYGLGLVYHLL